MRFLIVLLVSLAGCAPTLQELTDNRYSTALPVGSLEAIERELHQELEELGYDVRTSRRKVARAWTGLSTVWMPPTFEEWPIHERVSFLAHELAHARQWHKRDLFGMRYTLSGKFRAICEVQAHREEVRILRRRGVSEENVRAWAAGRARMMKKSYLLLHPTEAEITEALISTGE